MTGASKRESVVSTGSPAEVAQVDRWDSGGDAADQAERLTMIMAAEALHTARMGRSDEGTNDLPYPLEDVEAVLAMAGAEDGSDDPLHAGGQSPDRWLTAEESAIHVVGENDEWLEIETSTRHTDTEGEFDGPGAAMTPEDQTLLGVDPYDA